LTQTTSDLIYLPFTPDLTEAGIGYALRSLPHTYNRMGGSLLTRLQRIAGGKAVERALRRYLVAQGVPTDRLGETSFTDADLYDLSIGGRRCDLKSFQIFPEQGADTPEYLLEAAALVPADQLASTRLSDDDLYLFAFSVLGRSSPIAPAPEFWIHPLPHDWAQPATWRSLGELVLKSESLPILRLEVGGQVSSRAFQVEPVLLPPQKRTLLRTDFFSLAYLHALQRPAARVGAHGPVLKQTHVIEVEDWGDVWVNGQTIILAGWLTLGEFRQRAHFLPSGSQVPQYARTRTDNWALPVRELKPVSSLISAL